MHSPKGQPSPAASLDRPHDNKDTVSNSSSSSSLRSHVREKSTSLTSALHHLSHDSKHKNKGKGKDSKDISKIISASLMTTTILGQGIVPSPVTRASVEPSFPRERSGSTSSQQSTKSSKSATTTSEQQPLAASHAALLPTPLPRSSLDDNSIRSSQSSVKHGHGPSHHHIRLPSFLKRPQHSSSLDSSSSSSSSTLQIPSHPHQRSLQQHTILMAPTHDIHLTWPYPVPSGNAFVAGTWSVPGHGPWEKLPMSRIPGTDMFEIHLNVQEVEDISDYLDDEGYLHHDLLQNHHAHDHSFHETQTSSAPSTPPSTPLSRRQRFSRFFGRSLSSSTASSSAEASKGFHPDLPYHHQSRDGIILPLTREYRYQFKFVIDNEWKCDPTRHQVPDSEGNWNNEVVVDLVEQIRQHPPSANRSRSSSLQSQHNDHTTETEKAQDIPLADDATATLLSPPAPPVPDQSDSVSPSTATTTTNITTKGLESKDTFEGVFNERDDLSDGEGLQPLKSDDDNDHDNISNNNNNENVGNDAAEGDVVAPQQVQPHQEQTAPLAIDQDEHHIETPDAAILVSSVAADPSVSEPDVHEDKSSNSSSALPEIGEHSFIVPTVLQENAEIIKEEIATTAVDLDDPAVASVAPKAVDEPLVTTATAVTPQRQMSYAAAVMTNSVFTEEPKPFVLQASANPEEKRNNNKAARAALEVVTDAPAAMAYSQVPSPPLTPSSYATDDDSLKDEHLEDEYLPGPCDASVLLTPRSDMPLFRHLKLSEKETKIVGARDHSNGSVDHGGDDDGSETLDVLSDHTSIPSSSSSSTLGSRSDQTIKLPEQYPNIFWSMCKTTAVVSAAVVVIGLGLGRRRN